MAQGTETAWTGMAIFVLTIVGFFLLAIIMLVIFIVSRHKIVRIVSALLGFLLIIGGTGISLLGGKSPGPEFQNLSGLLKVTGLINLILIYIFSQIFPKKSTKTDETEEKAKQPDLARVTNLKWLGLGLGICFLNDLNSAFEFWRRTSTFSSEGNLYFKLMQFLPLIFLLITLILFYRHKRVGWILLIFYSYYTIFGIFISLIRTSILKPSGSDFNIPLSHWIIQFSIIIFFSLCLLIIQRENVRTVFSVGKKTAFITVLSGIMVAGLILLSDNLFMST